MVTNIENHTRHSGNRQALVGSQAEKSSSCVVTIGYYLGLLGLLLRLRLKLLCGTGGPLGQVVVDRFVLAAKLPQHLQHCIYILVNNL